MANYYVYVIELDPKVADLRKFRAKNPKYIKGNGCLYIGQSQKNHRSGLNNLRRATNQINMQNIMELSLDQISMRNTILFQLEKTLKKLKRCLAKFYESKDTEFGLINLSLWFFVCKDDDG